MRPGPDAVARGARKRLAAALWCVMIRMGTDYGRKVAPGVPEWQPRFLRHNTVCLRSAVAKESALKEERCARSTVSSAPCPAFCPRFPRRKAEPDQGSEAPPGTQTLPAVGVESVGPRRAATGTADACSGQSGREDEREGRKHGETSANALRPNELLW